MYKIYFFFTDILENNSAAMPKYCALAFIARSIIQFFAAIAIIVLCPEQWQ